MSSKSRPHKPSSVSVMDSIMSMSHGYGWHYIGIHRKYWRLRLYTYENLEGLPPPGHPTDIKRNPVIAQIEVNQVWVEKGTRGLWVVEEYFEDSKGRKLVRTKPYFPIKDGVSTLIDNPHGITLTALSKVVSVNNFRANRRLWDDQVIFLKKLHENK